MVQVNFPLHSCLDPFNFRGFLEKIKYSPTLSDEIYVYQGFTILHTGLNVSGRENQECNFFFFLKSKKTKIGIRYYWKREIKVGISRITYHFKNGFFLNKGPIKV